MIFSPLYKGEFLYFKEGNHMGKFKKFVPGRVDRKTQEKKKLSDLEELILKPHRKGIKALTTEEFDRYINLNIEELKRTKINAKTIVIADSTKSFLIENKETILKEIKEKEENENER